ncbi:PRC-barrel domain-containing protein [Azospirillum canadense]|uniref:PRC-barrel domain-containing protein n=1 Tax=Azospirillum canadense TaxID=403962 RepID=UPI00222761B9|nr:PRC-barrel domain-containing protein [Azospirillum canadense]MCW2242401.1 sporulation protein YlmC with PRC-barrel domain [Azospirillum canadense]
MNQNDIPTAAIAPPAPSAALGTEMTGAALLGRTVYGEGEEQIGTVVDIVLDPHTHAIHQLVIEGTDLSNSGHKTVAVDMGRVQVRPEQGVRITGLTRGGIAAMPDFTPDDASIALGRSSSKMRASDPIPHAPQPSPDR